MPAWKGRISARAFALVAALFAADSTLAATLQITVPGPYAENGGQSTFNVQLTRDAGDVGACQVTGEVNPGNPTPGNSADPSADFSVASTSFDLTIAAGVGSATQTFPIDILDDLLYEGPFERISLSLDNVDFAGCPAFIVTVVSGTNVGTITENETPQFTLGFTQSNIAVDESAGSTDYTVDFQPGNLAPNTYTMTTDVVSNPGTASTADFTPVNQQFQFTIAGAQTGTVAITSDTIPEATESFTLDATAVLIDRDGAPLTVNATQPQLAIDIVDDDGGTPGFVEFTQPTFSVDEGAGTVTVSVARSGGTTGVVTAGVSAFTDSGDSATEGADFTPTNATLTWADGDGAPKTLTVAILEDTDIEQTETFTVQIGTVTGGGAGNLSRASVNVADNDDLVDPGPDENVSGIQGNTVSLTFGVSGAAPFTLATNLGTVNPTTLPAPGNATFTFTIPQGTQTGTVFVASIGVTNANGTTVTKDVTITVVDSRVLGDIPGLTPNQLALARYLDVLCPRLSQQQNVTDEQGQILGACGGLRDTATPDAQVRGALDAINPEELIVAATMALRLTSMQNGNLMQRVNSLRSGASGIDLAGLNVQIGDQAIAGVAINEVAKAAFDTLMGGGASADDFGRWGLFANGNVKFGDKDATENEAAFDYDTIGITAGVDYRFRDDLVFGVALGYASVASDFTSSNGELDIEAWSASVFGTYFSADRFYIDGMITYGQNDYETMRQISYADAFNVYQETARGDTDGMQFSGGLSGGYDFNKGPWTLGPHIGAYYFDVDVDQFAETGASGFNMLIGDQDAQSFQLNAGGHASVVLNQSWGVFIPHARVDFVHEFEDSAELVGVTLANDPFATDPTNPTPVITLRTDRPDSDYFVFSVGASAQFINGVSGFVNYRTMAGFDDFSMNEFTWGLRFERSF